MDRFPPASLPASLGFPTTSWDPRVAKRPECTPQSTQGPSVLQSASIHNPPCVKCEVASRVGNWTCADPGRTSNSSNLVSEAPD
eukprot:13919487-Alexandrium_andersonii.AAC.1